MINEIILHSYLYQVLEKYSVQFILLAYFNSHWHIARVRWPHVASD